MSLELDEISSEALVRELSHRHHLLMVPWALSVLQG